MSAGAVTEPVQVSALRDVLTLAAVGPAALVIEGEAGIGKTTLWLAGAEEARAQGFTVLVARPVAVESVLAYASLADLLAGADTSAWAMLPEPQRRAVDRIMSRADEDGSPSDQQAVAAGFLSAIEGLAEQKPVLVAIDDLQWLDSSSARVIGFAARRLSGRVGVLATLRTEADVADGAAWLQLPRPDAIRRIGVPALSLGGLHTMITERLGRSFSRPTLVRIMDISGGNPFYAMELGRAIGASAPGRTEVLPGTLSELVQARIGALGAEVHDALLAIASLAAPNVELVAQAVCRDKGRVVGLLEDAETKGIIAIDGNRLRFAHPLLARGVYVASPPAQRRDMHARLAQIVDEPELRARHLALAATESDPHTLQALDVAAQRAAMRGAPAAAAELLDLAMALGGDTPERTIRAATYHHRSGDSSQAKALLDGTIDQLPQGPLRAHALNQLAVVYLDGESFLEAAGLLEQALAEAGADESMRVQALLSLSYSMLNLQQLDASMRAVDDAIVAAEKHLLGNLLRQAVGMRVLLRFMRGEGLDDQDLRRALELGESQDRLPIACRPGMHHAILLAWTGRLQQAQEAMATIQRRCIDSGEESELMLVAFHAACIAIWRADLTEARQIGADAAERASQLGGDFPLSTALAIRSAIAAYAGDADDARRSAIEALEASQRCGSYALGGWPVTTLGFLDVSLGAYESALATLSPLLALIDATPDATEIYLTWFVPDAVEAMVALGRLEDAEPLIDKLERNGRRLDRPWMLAIGSRCRAMLLAACGDVDAANVAAQQAMTEHDRLPMPFERARTQLLLGQLQRRCKQKDAAAATLREALTTFESLGTPLWADKVRTAIARSNVGPKRTPGLTPSEQRVAELAASGMTNRDVAAELFISPKTVEANLSRIYHKLGIRSRAELGRHMGGGIS